MGTAALCDRIRALLKALGDSSITDTAMQLFVVHIRTGLLFFGKRVALGRRETLSSLSISV